MMSKLETFLKEHKIDSRRLISVSKRLEALRPEDRALRLAKRTKTEGGSEKKEAPTGKSRSGRPVTSPTLNAALSGKAISSSAKTRISKAVNHILSQKKKDPITVRDLW